ncbi:MAG TPA: Gfo/Idh/MocA family oxidoreductase [Verrucomicrobiae bacterium]|nr:Gfo/Idh/MocA family oxidoreductase [Verrucomicrobiae bacterium]
MEEKRLSRVAWRTSRRQFIKATGLASAAIALPTLIPASALGRGGAVAPSERIRVGGIGLGNQGGSDFGGFLGSADVQYVAVCDVRKNVRDGKKAQVDEHYHSKDCVAYNDFRELLAREDIDAVHVATPDHWHALVVTEACRRGKDVFCQKPETLTLREGPLMIEYARRYGRVVSGGSQRVLEDYRGTVDMCWGGKLGQVLSINVITNNLSHACNLAPEPVPEGFDWEMWLGPAPWAPYNSKRCDGNFSTVDNSWRSYWDYSGGEITDWGAHHFGGATFAVDVRELQPQEIIYHAPEGQNRAYLEFIYPNGIRITHCKPGKANMEVDSDEHQTRAPKPVPGYKGKGSIIGDFLYCVRSREKPFRDIELAVNTVSLCHLGTIAYRLQRSLKWDAAKQTFPGDAEANRFTDRARRQPWQL